MFKKKEKKMPAIREIEIPPIRMAVLTRVGEQADPKGSGEFLVLMGQGRVIATACMIPEPWQLEEKGMSGYAAFLEEPGSGDRVRMDMARVGEREWASVRSFASDLSGYCLAYICPVGDGKTGSPLLSGLF